MKLNEAFPSQYLSAADLNGSPVTVSITGVAVETFGQGKDAEDKPVASLKNTSKRLVINKTNWKTIASLHGEDSDAWIGKQITLVVRDVDMAGESKPAIRVSTTKPSPAATKPLAEGDPEPEPAL